MAELLDICSRLSAGKNQFLQFGDDGLTRPSTVRQHHGAIATVSKDVEIAPDALESATVPNDVACWVNTKARSIGW